MHTGIQSHAIELYKLKFGVVYFGGDIERIQFTFD